MIRFAQFRRKFMTWRMSQLTSVHELSELNELPVNSICHILDNFQMNSGSVNFAPSFTNPILTINNYKLLMTHVTGLEEFKEVVPVIRNRIRLTAAGVLSAFNAYRREMKGRVLVYPNIQSIPFRPNTQAVVNYNSIFRARVMGIRRKPRFLNFLFAYILNCIMTAKDKQHFIHIPLEALIFEKMDFIKVFKKYDRIATKYPDISSYIFLAHLYAILMKKMTLPKRGEMDGQDEEEEVATETLDIDPATWDDELTSEEFLTNIQEYLLHDTDTALEALNIKDTENPYKNSIFEFIPPAMFENINIILTCGNNFIIYNLRDLKEMNGTGGTGIMKIIKHINMLAAAGAPTSDTKPVESEPESVDEEITNIEEGGQKANEPEFVAPMTKEEKQDALDQDLAELDNVTNIINANIDVDKPLSKAQKDHVAQISKSYKKLTLNGKTFEQLLTEVPDDNFMDTLPDIPDNKKNDGKTTSKDKEAVIVDKTFIQSKAADLDSEYIEKLMDKDMAAILTSFNKQGMFLTDLQQKDLVDDLNSRTEFTVKFEDLNHKNHKFSFSIPKVDKFGNFMDNGSLKTINKQRVSNPICKAKADRVTLNSNYNKLLVERNTNSAHDFMSWFKTSMQKIQAAGVKLMFIHGDCKYPIKAFPYEITELGSKYLRINFKDGFICFDIMNRGNSIPEKIRDAVIKKEKECGVWFGCRGDEQFYITVTGLVCARNIKTDEETFYGAFIDFLEYITGVQLNPMVEYAQLTVLSRVVPVIHVLGYKYGLSNMLKYCNTNYEIYDINARVERRTSDIVIKFKDKKLIIHRNPRVNALLFGGLCIYDFSEILYEDMDNKDVYYEMLSQKKVSTNLIKGIDALFNLFIDPITRDVLREMREPTDLRDLLIRAVTMLTTTEHKHEASASNFRFRGVEQITGIVYNELAKAFAGYKNRSVGSSNKFSISAYAVSQRVVHHQLVENVSTINPINDIKQYSKFSNSGDGGRSNDTFMISDRQFTKDQLGIVSEASVDNGKVGLNASLPLNPVFSNARGMALSDSDIDKLEPDNVLSITSLIMPGATNDDSKRVTFANIQLSHYVPIKESDVSRVRTGFENVVAQKCTDPRFAYSAKEDGIIDKIDDVAKTIVVRYKDGKKICLPYGSEPTNNSANGFYVDQEVTINNFKKGDKFKKGDILTYNRQYFKADPYSKQVKWKIGTLSKVAIMDNGGTVEDASIITKPLSDRMTFNPIHVKEIVITKNTNVHAFADVGQNVVNTDPLIVFDESAMQIDDGGDPELQKILGDLNKSAPKAEHSGVVMKIDALYKCSISDMTPTLQKLVRHVIKMKNARATDAEGCFNANEFRKSAPLEATTKVGKVDMTNDTVILRFYIKQEKVMHPGDKLFFDTALKSVVSTVYDDYIYTEDGEKVEAATSGRGILARLITSPFLTGVANAVLEKLEQNILNIWDGKK